MVAICLQNLSGFHLIVTFGLDFWGEEGSRLLNRASQDTILHLNCFLSQLTFFIWDGSSKIVSDEVMSIAILFSWVVKEISISQKQCVPAASTVKDHLSCWILHKIRPSISVHRIILADKKTEITFCDLLFWTVS